ncbi:MAG TPA: hypothetical protein VKS79_11185 [Gemmataceae bacterium]|nr:hypothetical protein [Gemmataceae bacterium]
MGQGTSLRRTWPRALLALGAALPLNFAALGCGGGIMDDLRSREFRFRDVFNHQDPLVALESETNGDERARAMHRLKEPLQNGGTQEQQDKMMKVLTESATTDNRAVCRMAAIDALAKMKDGRATPVLVQAYTNASTFQLDVANAIRVDAITALGSRSDADAVALLVKAASDPGIDVNAAAQQMAPAGIQQTSLLRDKPKPSAQDAEVEKSLARDIRLAAIRALATSRSPKATDALIAMLDEKDIAIRDRAQEALEAITGKKGVKPEAKAWQEAMAKKQ